MKIVLSDRRLTAAPPSPRAGGRTAPPPPPAAAIRDPGRELADGQPRKLLDLAELPDGGEQLPSAVEGNGHEDEGRGRRPALEVRGQLFLLRRLPDVRIFHHHCAALAEKGQRIDERNEI